MSRFYKFDPNEYKQHQQLSSPQEQIKSTTAEKHSVSYQKDASVWSSGLVKVLVVIFVLFAMIRFFPIPFGSISIEGSKEITVEDVLVAGNSSYPVNIVQIDSTAVEERLSKDLRVKKVLTAYEFPLTLKVLVEEREAVGIVMTQFGYAVVDEQGQVIALTEGLSDSQAPLVSGIRLGNVLLGDFIANDEILQGLLFLKSLSAEGKKEVSEINVGNPGALTAYTVSGIPLRLGNKQDLPEKAKLAEDMLHDIQMKNMKVLYVDVNISAPFIGQDK